MSSLKNTNLDLNLRTELLKFIRKIYIDLTYSESNNKIYTNSIITIEDHLLLLKTNPLISNLRYPTKLFSYFKDFLNLSIYSEIREESQTQIEKKEPSHIYTFKLNNNQAKIEEVESSICQSNKEKNVNEEDEGYINYQFNKSLENSLYSNKSHSKSNYTKQNKKKPFKPCFDNKIYELLMYELININQITSGIKLFIDSDMEMLKNYLENGLLIPIIYFLKRTFVFSHCFSGKEMIKLYNLIIESCNLRLYISEYKYDFWKEIFEEKPKINKTEKQFYNSEISDFLKEEEENFCKIYNNKRSIINGSFCINSNYNISTINSLNLLKTQKFLCFDFTSLYNIFELNIFSLLKDRNVNTYKEFFIKEGKDTSLKMIKKKEKNLLSNNKSFKEIEKRIMKLYLLYKI